jgi:phosphate transport system permease protein
MNADSSAIVVVQGTPVPSRATPKSTLRRRRVADAAATGLLWTAAIIVMGVLAAVVVTVVTKGMRGISSLSFFSKTLDGIGPIEIEEGIQAGAAHAIVGTLIIVGLASLIAIPVGMLTAIYVRELRGPGSTIVRWVIDAMAGVPSIIAGLFVFAVWVVRGHDYSGVAGSLALSILMLPTIARTSDDMLSLVPDLEREAALALGAPRWRMIVSAVLPSARSGLVTATLLGVARVAGETAPLLMTAFGTDIMRLNPNDGQMSALPLFIRSMAQAPEQSLQDLAWAGALALLLIVLVLFSAARIASRTKSTRR